MTLAARPNSQVLVRCSLSDPLQPVVNVRFEATRLANFPKKQALALLDDRRFNRLQNTPVGESTRLFRVLHEKGLKPSYDWDALLTILFWVIHARLRRCPGNGNRYARGKRLAIQNSWTHPFANEGNQAKLIEQWIARRARNCKVLETSVNFNSHPYHADAAASRFPRYPLISMHS
jgi:hypothetical protein